jgi:type IV pilus assembly protein PilF
MNRRVLAVMAIAGFLQACASSSERPASGAVDPAVANMNLGAGYLRQGRPDLAIERLQRALDQNPRLADAHSTIAIAYDQQGNYELAENHYRRATQLDPGNGAAANAYAVFLCRQDRFRDAEPYFRRAGNSRNYATPHVAFANAGVCAASAGELGKAEEFFRAALQREPTMQEALAGMIDISYRNGNYLQTRAFVQRYLDARPPTPAVLLICFNAERELGNRAAADRCAMQLRDAFPESPEVAQLQELLQRDGN